MCKNRWLVPNRRNSFILVLAIPLIVSGFMWPKPPGDPQQAERKGLEMLRTLMDRGQPPSEEELRRLESHYPRTRAAGLARFGRGRARYSAGDFTAAVELLSDAVIEQKTALGDHALFLVADSHRQLKRPQEAEAAFARLIGTYQDSTVFREASFAAAQLAADRGAYREAISYLSRLAGRHDASALWQTAQLYNRVGDSKRALDVCQEIYLELPPSQEALEAEKQLQAAGLLTTDAAQIPWARLRGRFEKLYHAGAYADAVQFYERFLAKNPTAVKDEKLTLHYGRSLQESSSARRAIEVLKKLSSTASDVQSERLYALAESYARAGLTAAFLETSQSLVKQFPKSSWAAATLYSRAKYHQRTGGEAAAMQAFKELVKLHPESKYAPEATYQVGMNAYFSGRYREAATVLVHHVEHYVNSNYYGPTLYWAGRASERDGQTDQAIAIFERLLDRYVHTFYGAMAQSRLAELRAGRKDSKPMKPNLSPALSQALAKVKPARPPQDSFNDEAAVHLQKGQDLRLVRVDDLAAKEFQEALRLAPGSNTVCLELARLYRGQGNYRASINILQQAHPEYTLYQGGEVSREVEEILFPLAYWETIRKESRSHGLDPYIVAGLIRQESAFDPNARSRANALGLMQLIPSTGQLVARRHGLPRLSSSQLFQPELNIRLGTSFFANLLEQLGRVEYATAAYNGGPARTARWRREIPYRDIDEWVENIPIRETRLYVQAVIRNAAQYRRIYGKVNGS